MLQLVELKKKEEQAIVVYNDPGLALKYEMLAEKMLKGNK
jgi:hypothetical protein